MVLFVLLVTTKSWNIKTANLTATILLNCDVMVWPLEEKQISGVLCKMVQGTYGVVDVRKNFLSEIS